MIEADLWLVPSSYIGEVVAAAWPSKSSWLRRGQDNFYRVLRGRARSYSYFEWWGYSLLMLLQYMRDHHSIDLVCCMESELAEEIHGARGTLCLTVGPDEAKGHCQALATVKLNEGLMRDFYNEFNEEGNADAGRAMLAGAEVVRGWLGEICVGTVGVILLG